MENVKKKTYEEFQALLKEAFKSCDNVSVTIGPCQFFQGFGSTKHVVVHTQTLQSEEGVELVTTSRHYDLYVALP